MLTAEQALALVASSAKSKQVRSASIRPFLFLFHLSLGLVRMPPFSAATPSTAKEVLTSGLNTRYTASFKLFLHTTSLTQLSHARLSLRSGDQRTPSPPGQT